MRAGTRRERYKYILDGTAEASADAAAAAWVCVGGHDERARGEYTRSRGYVRCAVSSVQKCEQTRGWLTRRWGYIPRPSRPCSRATDDADWGHSTHCSPVPSDVSQSTSRVLAPGLSRTCAKHTACSSKAGVLGSSDQSDMGFNAVIGYDDEGSNSCIAHVLPPPRAAISIASRGMVGYLRPSSPKVTRCCLLIMRQSVNVPPLDWSAHQTLDTARPQPVCADRSDAGPRDVLCSPVAVG